MPQKIEAYLYGSQNRSGCGARTTAWQQVLGPLLELNRAGTTLWPQPKAKR
jgi:hypothetical protein